MLEPFEDDLFRASLVDAPRLVNSLSGTWSRARFKPLDSQDDYQISRELQLELDMAKAVAFRELFKDQDIPPVLRDLLGREFPFERIFGRMPAIKRGAKRSRH